MLTLFLSSHFRWVVLLSDTVSTWACSRTGDWAKIRTLVWARLRVYGEAVKHSGAFWETGLGTSIRIIKRSELHWYLHYSSTLSDFQFLWYLICNYPASVILYSNRQTHSSCRKGTILPHFSAQGTENLIPQLSLNDVPNPQSYRQITFKCYS